MSARASDIPRESRHRALEAELRELADVVQPAPLVDLLLERSFEAEATDVHFDPREDGLHVRLRVDGVLHDVLTVKPAAAPQVVSRIKILAGMDITERRLCQDGHIASAALKRRRDVRVGSGPTIHGERLVLRLMPDETRYNRLEDLGFEPAQLELVHKTLRAPHGMLLSVGPVGCGKSSTIYSCLSVLNQPGRSLVTIEDPVERRIAGVNQMQTSPAVRFGFAEALRGALRQDPNVVMVGEIRDPETAQIATRAALTGILVLSTMHASDTGAIIDMFRQFEVPAMFVADSLNCVIAQRLVRKVCTSSRETYRPDAASAQALKLSPDRAAQVELVRGVPSDANFHTGYAGRTGIFEVLRVDEPVREAILREHPAREIHDLAQRNGMQTLEQSAINKVLAGVTTEEEMHRVLVGG
jgi:type II secretory ATPase GspE/PulE/Tfp pilus assembly ATPase PilB-like protein